MTDVARSRTRIALSNAALFVVAMLATLALFAALASADDPPATAPVAAADPADDIAAPNVGPYRDAGVVAETHLDGNGPKVAPPLVLPDPVDEPAKAYAATKETLAEDGRWAALAVVATMLLRALSKRIKTTSALKFLRRWRWPAIIGGAAGVSGAVTEALIAGGTKTAIALAVLAALITLVDGFGADEDKPAASPAA